MLGRERKGNGLVHGVRVGADAGWEPGRIGGRYRAGNFETGGIRSGSEPCVGSRYVPFVFDALLQ